MLAVLGVKSWATLRCVASKISTWSIWTLSISAISIVSSFSGKRVPRLSWDHDGNISQSGWCRATKGDRSSGVRDEEGPRSEGHTVSTNIFWHSFSDKVFRWRYYGKIQDKDTAYYMEFHIIICGLDSVEARRWMNATLVNLVDPDNQESLKPLIDGGTEGMCSVIGYIFQVLCFGQDSRVKLASSSPPLLPVMNAHWIC